MDYAAKRAKTNLVVEQEKNFARNAARDVRRHNELGHKPYGYPATLRTSQPSRPPGHPGRGEGMVARTKPKRNEHEVTQLREDVQKKEEKLKKYRQEWKTLKAFLEKTATKEQKARTRLEMFISHLLDRASRAELELNSLKSSLSDQDADPHLYRQSPGTASRGGLNPRSMPGVSGLVRHNHSSPDRSKPPRSRSSGQRHKSPANKSGKKESSLSRSQPKSSSMQDLRSVPAHKHSSDWPYMAPKGVAELPYFRKERLPTSTPRHVVLQEQSFQPREKSEVYGVPKQSARLKEAPAMSYGGSPLQSAMRGSPLYKSMQDMSRPSHTSHRHSYDPYSSISPHYGTPNVTDKYGRPLFRNTSEVDNIVDNVRKKKKFSKSSSSKLSVDEDGILWDTSTNMARQYVVDPYQKEYGKNDSRAKDSGKKASGEYPRVTKDAMSSLQGNPLPLGEKVDKLLTSMDSEPLASPARDKYDVVDGPTTRPTRGPVLSTASSKGKSAPSISHAPTVEGPTTAVDGHDKYTLSEKHEDSKQTNRYKPDGKPRGTSSYFSKNNPVLQDGDFRVESPIQRALALRNQNTVPSREVYELLDQKPPKANNAQNNNMQDIKSRESPLLRAKAVQEQVEHLQRITDDEASVSLDERRDGNLTSEGGKGDKTNNSLRMGNSPQSMPADERSVENGNNSVGSEKSPGWDDPAKSVSLGSYPSLGPRDRQMSATSSAWDDPARSVSLRSHGSAGPPDRQFSAESSGQDGESLSEDEPHKVHNGGPSVHFQDDLQPPKEEHSSLDDDMGYNHRDDSGNVGRRDRSPELSDRPTTSDKLSSPALLKNPSEKVEAEGGPDIEGFANDLVKKEIQNAISQLSEEGVSRAEEETVLPPPPAALLSQCEEPSTNSEDQSVNNVKTIVAELHQPPEESESIEEDESFPPPPPHAESLQEMDPAMASFLTPQNSEHFDDIPSDSDDSRTILPTDSESAMDKKSESLSPDARRLSSQNAVYDSSDEDTMSHAVNMQAQSTATSPGVDAEIGDVGTDTDGDSFPPSTDVATDTDLELSVSSGVKAKGVRKLKSSTKHKHAAKKVRMNPRRSELSQESATSGTEDLDDYEKAKRRAARRRKKVLLLVFAYLDNETLLKVSEVCKDWCQASRNPLLWKHVVLKDRQISAQFLITLSERCKMTETLHLQGLRGRGIQSDEDPQEYSQNIRGSLEPGLERVLSSCQDSITSLRIEDCDNILTDKCLWLISTYCRLLTRLTYRSALDPITGQLIWALGGGCPGVTSLKIQPLQRRSEKNTLNNHCLLLIGQFYSDLREVAIGGQLFDMAGLLPLVQSCQKLKSIHMESCIAFTEDVASALCRSGLKHLEKLVIWGTGVEAKAVEICQGHCRQLKSVHIKVRVEDCVEDLTKKKEREKYKKMVKALEDLQMKPGFKNMMKVEAVPLEEKGSGFFSFFSRS